MSPEQVRGEEVDHRSDIFSFGTVVYELLVGEHPFRRATPVQTMNAVLEHEPSGSGGRLDALTDAVRVTLRKMLAKAVADRYQSVADVRKDIGDLTSLAPRTSTAASSLTDATTLPVPSRRAGFVGREAELADLREVLDRGSSGSGAWVNPPSSEGISWDS